MGKFTINADLTINHADFFHSYVQLPGASRGYLVGDPMKLATEHDTIIGPGGVYPSLRMG